MLAVILSEFPPLLVSTVSLLRKRSCLQRRMKRMVKQHIVHLHKNVCANMVPYELHKVCSVILDTQLLALHFDFC